jgi:predicted RNA methylase
MLNLLGEVVRHPVLSTRLIVRRIREIPSKGLPRLRRHTDDSFDRRFGVETAQVVRVTATDSPNLAHGNRYEAATEAAIRWAIEASGLAPEQTTFVDVGCGKGRALVLAASFPFKAIAGVEYAPELVQACIANLEKVGAAERCQVTTGDAVDYRFPDGDLLAFFYNPFGEVVHRRVLDNLAAAGGRVRFAHSGPGHEVVRAWGRAREIAAGPDATRLYEIV